MMNSMMLPLIILALCPLALIAILVFSPKRVKGKKQSSVKKYAKINIKHKRYANSIFTRGDYLRLVEAISRLSIYNFQEVRYRAVRYYEISTVILLTIWVVGTFIARDLTMSILLAFFAFMIKNVYINKNLDKSKRQLLDQFQDTLSSIREEYTRLGNIPDSLADCRKGNLVVSQIDSIYNICTSVDGEDRLQEFYSKCQFRQLKTLASICYIINDMGDTTTINGTSTFKSDLSLIKDEVDLEIRKNQTIKLKFGLLEWLPVVPLFGIYMVQAFFMNFIPGTSLIYNGIYGYIARLLIVLSSFIGYYVISTVNSDQYIRNNDRLPLVDWFLKFHWFKQYCVNWMDKSMKAKIKTEKILRNALSSKDAIYIQGEKIIFSTIILIGALVSSVIMVMSAKNYIYNSADSLSLVGSVPYTHQEYKDLLEYDKTVMARKSLDTDEAMRIDLKGILTNATDFTLIEEINRIKTKYKAYHSMSYKWWYVIICYLCAMAAWKFPYALLKFRTYMVRTEAEEDVLQMQTVIASLMDTQLDTLEVLYWLEKNSVIHKDALRLCYHEYPSDADKALTRLKHQSTVPEFTRIVDKLMSTIHQISIGEAFSDLIAERSHSMKLRELSQMESIMKKRAVASPLALAPIYALAFGMMVGPIAILGFIEFTKAFAQAGF